MSSHLNGVCRASDRSLANRHSCLTLAKLKIPIAEGMINHQTICFIHGVVSKNRYMLGYKKFIQVIAVVVVIVIVI